MGGTEFWILAVLSAVCVGLSKGGLPAVSLLAVPLLALKISPVVAAGLLLPVYVVSDIVGLWAYRKAFSWPVLKVAFWGLTLGIAVGWATAAYVPERAVRVLIGIVGLAFALNLLRNRKKEVAAKPVETGPGIFWTGLAGFTSFVAHAGAPPWQVWVLPMKLDKMVFAGTSTIAFAFANAVKLVPYYFLGQLGVENLRVAAMLMLPAALSVLLGLKLVQRLPEKLFFSLVTWALLLVSVKLIWDGLMA